MGWDDAPQHICRGGDIRGLAFCCPPIKRCPTHKAIREAGLTHEEYIKIKMNFARKTKLGEGEGTCFGSLVWCCKVTKPCPYRDAAMARANLTPEEYMELKKQLAFEITKKKRPKLEKKERLMTINALSAAFGISSSEVEEVLEQTNGDVKKAMKILKIKQLES
ncbi:MAG: methanogenesis marker 9 domain-containing protein [Candidatus Hydrothermarchaeota archaeon]